MQRTFEEVTKAVGNKIASLREQRGLTQYKLAKLLFIEQTSLARIEKGLTNPTIKTIYNIAVILEIDIRDLL